MIEKDFEDHHILFRDPEKRSHLETIFQKLLANRFEQIGPRA
jgi:hypothetical protein